MAQTRAYAVPIRNDLSDSLVQFTDVFPNTSQTTDLFPVGQTGYVNPGFFVTNPTAGQPPVYEFPLGFGLPTVSAGGLITNTGYVDGLAAWAADNLCAFGAGGADNGKALNATQLKSWAARVVCRAVKGQSLTVTDLCTCLVSVGSIASGPATDSYTTSLVAGGCGQIGAVGTNKTNAVMVEEVLKILSGQVYRMLNGAQVNDGATPPMYTLVAHNPATSTGVVGGPTRSGFLTAPNTNTTAAQTFPASLDFVPYRNYYYGAEILASSQEGQLAKFATHQLGAGSFYFKAAKLSDGQTTATYGYSATTSTAGTARALQLLTPITTISNANPAVLTAGVNHGLVVNDVIRVRGLSVVGSVLSNTVYKVKAVTGVGTVTLKSIANVDVNNSAAAGNSTGGFFSLESSAPTAAVVTATDSVNIPTTNATAYEFRAIVVYDNEGNVLSI